MIRSVFVERVYADNVPPKTRIACCTSKTNRDRSQEFYFLCRKEESKCPTFDLYHYLPTCKMFRKIDTFLADLIRPVLIYRNVSGFEGLAIFSEVSKVYVEPGDGMKKKPRSNVELSVCDNSVRSVFNRVSLFEYSFQFQSLNEAGKDCVSYSTAPTLLDFQLLYSAKSDNIYLLGRDMNLRGLAMYRFSFQSRVWEMRGILDGVSSLEGFSMAWKNSDMNQILLFGGREMKKRWSTTHRNYQRITRMEWELKRYYNDLYEYDMESQRVTKLRTFGTIRNFPVKLYNHSCVVYNRKMFIYGGESDEKVTAVGVYQLNMRDLKWTRLFTRGDDIPRDTVSGHLSGLYFNGITEKVKFFVWGGEKTKNGRPTKKLFDFQLHESMHENQQQERIDYLVDKSNGFLDFTVQFFNVKIRTFCALLSLESEVVKRIIKEDQPYMFESDKSVNLESDDVAAVLLGVDHHLITGEDVTKYVDLFIFFEELQMEKYCHLMTIYVRRLFDVYIMYTLFCDALKRAGDPNRCMLTGAIIDVLESKEKIVENGDDRELKERYRKFKKLVKKKKINMKKHRDCLGYLDRKYNQQGDFKAAFDYAVAKLFKTNNSSMRAEASVRNMVSIVSTEKRAKYFVNKEILVFKSNFFFQFRKFQSNCFDEMPVKLEYLNDATMKVLLEYMHFGRFNLLQDLADLFILTHHAEMYFEDTLKGKCMHAICKAYETFYEKGSFKEEYDYWKDAFESLPDSVSQDLMEHFQELFRRIREKEVQKYLRENA